ISGFSSMLSLAIVTLSPSSPAISSSAGAIIRHGPHHSAQKSTRTGVSEPRTSEAKLWSVTVLVAMARDSPGGVQKLTSIWALHRRLSRHQFDEFGARCIQEGRANLPSRKDDLKGFNVGLHLRAVRIGYIGVGCRHLAGLEVDHSDAIVLDTKAVDRAGDHATVGKRRRKRCFAERAWAEQPSETRIGENSAYLRHDLLAEIGSGNSGRAFKPAPGCLLTRGRFDRWKPLEQLVNPGAAHGRHPHGLTRRRGGLVIISDGRRCEGPRRPRFDRCRSPCPFRNGSPRQLGLVFRALRQRPVGAVAQRDMAFARRGNGLHRRLDHAVPAIRRARVGAVLAFLGPNPAYDQPVGGAGQRDIEQPEMLFLVALLLGQNDLLEGRATFVLFGSEERRNPRALELDVYGQRCA